MLWVQEWLFLYLLLIKLWVGRWNPDFSVEENLEVMTERHDQVDGQSAPLKSAWRIISQMRRNRVCQVFFRISVDLFMLCVLILNF